MKAIYTFVFSVFFALNALASPPTTSDLYKEVPGAKSTYGGIKNFKMVMPGVLYRGGGTGGKEPLGNTPLQALCEGGFTSAYYVYNTGFRGKENVSCQSSNGGQLEYDYKQWDSSSQGKAMLADIYQTIKRGYGAVYVHCWYGVHASGYVAAIALRQFCGYSDSQAVDYWNKNVPASIRYEKVQKKILEFQPYSEFLISSEEQTRVCP